MSPGSGKSGRCFFSKEGGGEERVSEGGETRCVCVGVLGEFRKCCFEMICLQRGKRRKKISEFIARL